jgi:MFS transporter, DHA2 family, methylenomycin A resistance protein
MVQMLRPLDEQQDQRSVEKGTNEMMTRTVEAAHARPIGTEPPAATAMTLFVVCFGFFMVLLDASALNVALPAIHTDFAGSFAAIQWVVNAYTVLMASVLLTGGILGDRLGAREVFIASLILFVVGSVAASVSTSLETLVAARVVQGVAAGGMLPTSLAVIAHSYPNGAQRAKALAIWGGVSSLALVFGPVVGGTITGSFGWRFIFLLNVPVGIVALLLSGRHVPKTATDPDASLDLAGQLTSMLTFGALVGGLIESGVLGWIAPPTVGLLAVALVAGLTFVAVELRGKRPMLPLSLFSRSAFTAPVVIGFLFQLGAYGVQFILAIYVQTTWGLNAFEAGLAFLPFTLAWAFASLVLARIAAGSGPRILLTVGGAISVVGALMLLPLGATTAWPLFSAGTALMGLGAGLLAPSMPATIFTAVPAGQSGLASGTLNTSRQLGGAIGVALLGLFLESSHPIRGLHIDIILIATAFLMITIISLRYISRTLHG